MGRGRGAGGARHSRSMKEMAPIMLRSTAGGVHFERLCPIPRRRMALP